MRGRRNVAFLLVNDVTNGKWFTIKLEISG